MKLPLILALGVLLGGCLAQPDSTTRPAGVPCPEGTTRVDGECYVNGAPVAEGPCGCDAVACQAYDDWGMHGDGGNAAILCAAACQARCAGDAVEERLDVADALAAGMSCSYVPAWCGT